MTEDFQLNDGILIIDAADRYLKSQRFAGRSDIRKVIIPEGIGFFEEEVFAECVALENVQLPPGIINIGVAAFTGCSSLKEISIPSSVKEIEEGAFLFCESLERAELHEGLEKIADLAFQETALERITIPSTVREIGEEAFFECRSLQEANVLGKETLIGLNAFGSCYNLIKGYIAPGFPSLDNSSPAQLLYSLLWAGSYDRHSAEVSERATAFILENQKLIMERIIKCNNIPAMSGISALKLLDSAVIEDSLKQALTSGQNEISALLLAARDQSRNVTGDLEL